MLLPEAFPFTAMLQLPEFIFTALEVAVSLSTIFGKSCVRHSWSPARAIVVASRVSPSNASWLIEPVTVDPASAIFPSSPPNSVMTVPLIRTSAFFPVMSFTVSQIDAAAVLISPVWRGSS